jgi:hypothetical protein
MVQEDMYQAYIHSQAQFREHQVLDLEILRNVVGADIRQYLTYLSGLLGLLALPSTSMLRSGYMSSSPQCGLLRITAISTMHWQAQTIG